MPAASATADPDMPEKMSEAMTLTWPSPPLNRPTVATQKLRSRSVIEPAFMMLAAMMKSGTARSRKL